MKKTINVAFRLFIALCFITTFSGYSQQTKINKNSLQQKISKTGYIRCATVENEKMLLSKNPKRLSRNQFENWLAPIIATQQQKNLTNKTFAKPTIYTIPVVIHVIHDGDAINTSSSHLSENISDAQAASQITVLNQDFRKMSGTPGYGTTGYQLGVDCQIDFVLAKQDPYGVLTTGIEHLNLGKVDWSEEEIDAIVKPETQWDPAKYLNIWCVKFSSNLLGYAQFPSNSNLSGLNTIGGESLTDGVVINYDAFGTNAENDGSFQLNSQYNMGRTATHEVGHFLGLRHIWGDGTGDEATNSPDCTASDYCSDTPQAGWEHYVCGNFDTCTSDPGKDMTENYMDYTDDSCMNTFTAGQKARMVAVMTNSPRRKELSSSTVATPGFTKTLDAALKNILVSVSGCNTSFTPSINFENKGTTILQTVTIAYSIDNLNPKTFDWNGTLTQNTSGLINLPEIPLSSGTHQFSATITSINNLSDLNSLNDSVSKSFTIPPLSQLTGDATPQVTLTLQCDRDGSETTWTLKNSKGATLYSGGPYTDAVSSTQLNPPITANFSLENGECYTFTINDSYGDGINTNGGVGSYSLKDENNIVFASGGTFLFNESSSFSIGTLGNSKFETSNEIFIFPNPTKSTLNVHIPSHFGLPNGFSISNSLGKTILKKQVTKESDLTISTEHLSNGVYWITIVKENDKKTLRFIKE